MTPRETKKRETKKPEEQTAEGKARERLRNLSESLRRAAKHPGEADSIHRLRVSIRRFTQVLRVYGGVFSHSRKMRRRLRGLMDLCGAARNCDIAIEVLAASGVSADPRLEKLLKQRRARAAGDLAKLLKDRDSRAHMRRWREWLVTKGDVPGTAQVLRRLERDFKRYGAAAAKAGAGFEQMHKFRLLVKRYRYTLEILGIPPPDALHGLQERLGAINDCVTTADLSADLMDDIGLSAPERRKIKTALNRLLAHRAAEFRVYWRSQFSSSQSTAQSTARRTT